MAAVGGGAEPQNIAKGLDNSNLDTGAGDDTISINTNANSNGGWWWWNRGGNADSVGIDNNSSINTGAGNDSVYVNSFASGANTNAWAIRDSSIDVGSATTTSASMPQPSKHNVVTTPPTDQKTAPLI